MHKFGSIESFRHIYKNRDVNDLSVKYEATVKIHGTNGGVWYKDGELFAQSRNQILTEQNTNSGFFQFVMERKQDFIDLLSQFGDDVVLYGEYCGKGIQSGVAVSQLDKMFVYFQMKVDEEVVQLPESEIRNVYNIERFGKWNFEIDLRNPDLSEIEKLVEQIENVCPVGDYFGITGTGEGLVLVSVPYDSRFTFKAKGDKHKVAKVRNDVIQLTLTEIEQIELFLTEARFNQALENVELDIKNVGMFIKWVIDDILKEESDVLEQFGIKLVKKFISDKSKKWFFDRLYV